MDGISIVVCTFNGEKRIVEVLRHIVKLQSVCSWELIIVNNASTDSTVLICEQFLTANGNLIDWAIVTEDNPGLNFARKRGLEVSKFDFILFCDDDNLLHEQYLKVAYPILSGNSGIGVLGGCGIPIITGQVPGWFERFSHSYAVGHQAKQSGRLTDFPAEVYGACAFFRKEPLLSFFKNGFQTVMTDRKGNSLVSGGDVELCYLVQLSGYSVWFNSSLFFDHLIPANRLTWKYYLELKKGIVAGSAKLMAYRVLLEKERSSFVRFVSCYLTNLMRVFLVYLNFQITKRISTKYSQEDVDLAHAILPVKLIGFLTGFIPACKHFIFLSRFVQRHKSVR
jgi:glycosyltransferase involved in cell wall biosynthesis